MIDIIFNSFNSTLITRPTAWMITRAVLAVGELRVYVPPEPAPGPLHQAACGASGSLYFLAAYVFGDGTEISRLRI